MNPDVSNSPLAVLESDLTTLLQQQGATHAKLAKQQEAQRPSSKGNPGSTRSDRDQAHPDQKSTRGGLDYEDAVT